MGPIPEVQVAPALTVFGPPAATARLDASRHVDLGQQDQPGDEEQAGRDDGHAVVPVSQPGDQAVGHGADDGRQADGERPQTVELGPARLGREHTSEGATGRLAASHAQTGDDGRNPEQPGPVASAASTTMTIHPAKVTASAGR